MRRNQPQPIASRLSHPGRRLGRKGYFYSPTVLTGVEPGMAAFEEETFGPVAAVTRARDAGHALELANSSRFGLAASLWARARPRKEGADPRSPLGHRTDPESFTLAPFTLSCLCHILGHNMRSWPRRIGCPLTLYHS